ncbi:phosphoglycerate kinase [Nocardia sp. NPDC020380]|uniref:phosphoglycerate kinase n=1 Tax=Nocardia sp. NPDC020380 TaxID=3364309 RepID=UPI00379F6F41
MADVRRRRGLTLVAPTRSDRFPHLRNATIRPGDRWIFSAGFDVHPDLRETAPIDAELADLTYLLDAGARVAILSHQGNHHNRSALPLQFVAEYLTRKLARPVSYFPDCASPAAFAYAQELAPGTAALFGNTRAHPGEQSNDPELARNLARLGDAVAIGGFAKAHLSHASNLGILQFRPGFLASSIADELALLAPWASADPTRYSIAILGGTDSAGTLLGLDAFTRKYDLVIPAGTVLNALLAAHGHRIGSSVLGPDPAACIAIAQQVSSRPDRAEIHLPDTVFIADTRSGTTKAIPITDGVPHGWAIIDFWLHPWLAERMLRLRENGGRALQLGSPCLRPHPSRSSTDLFTDYLTHPAIEALLLEDPTTTDLPWPAPRSSGGTPALSYLAQGTLPILDALSSPPVN